MINISQKTRTSDRYNFKDYQEVTKQQYSTISPTHSLCTNCSDYYQEPPCQNNLDSNSGCFPSLISLDLN